MEATTDLLSITKYLRHAPKRRSCPPWSVPAEIWGMIVDLVIGLSKSFSGVGYSVEFQPEPLQEALSR
eukprot:3732888-Pyramimonas_sp.AAC.1